VKLTVRAETDEELEQLKEGFESQVCILRSLRCLFQQLQLRISREKKEELDQQNERNAAERHALELELAKIESRCEAAVADIEVRSALCVCRLLSLTIVLETAEVGGCA
jgi:CBS-domain-containing membrane protein